MSTPVGEAGIDACAGLLVGGTGACLLVSGAGSWPFGGQMGRTVSRDVSRGGCGLRKSLGSLFADG